RKSLPCRWCRREDSNLHSRYGNQLLKLARLPIPPLRRRVSSSYKRRVGGVNAGAKKGPPLTPTPLPAGERGRGEGWAIVPINPWSGPASAAASTGAGTHRRHATRTHAARSHWAWTVTARAVAARTIPARPVDAAAGGRGRSARGFRPLRQFTQPGFDQDLLHLRQIHRHHVHAGEPGRRQALQLATVEHLPVGVVRVLHQHAEGPVEALLEDLGVVVQVARQVL